MSTEILAPARIFEVFFLSIFQHLPLFQSKFVIIERYSSLSSSKFPIRLKVMGRPQERTEGSARCGRVGISFVDRNAK
jgi:hypothetical protein